MKNYYNSIEEYQNVPGQEEEKIEMEHKSAVLELFEDEIVNKKASRRDFLKVFGFSVTSAAVLSSCQKPIQKAIPYVIQPEEIVPGKALHYASTFFDGEEFGSILVKTRDGRPIKIEGNSLSAFNGKGTSANIQASVLSLYDDARLKSPLAKNVPASWDQADQGIMNSLDEINKEGGEIVLLTSTIISPSTKKLIKEFGSRYSHFRWIQYDAISNSAIREANQEVFGKAVIPDYHFEKAKMVVSFNADFLGSWLAPVHFISSYTSGRKLHEGQKDMNRHYHFESGMSLTGSNADYRYPIRPSQEKIVLANLYNKLAAAAGKETFNVPECDIDLDKLTAELMANKGKSIVVSGTNDKRIQLIVNAINLLLNSYESCIDLENHLLLSAGNDQDMKNLIPELNNGKIAALLIYNVNPAYDYSSSEAFRNGLQNVRLTVNMNSESNETVGLCGYECPTHHYLESWGDAEITPGKLSLAQPCIHPIFDTRSFQDSLLKWMGKSDTWHDYLMLSWKDAYYPNSGKGNFETFWTASLKDGTYNYNPNVTKSQEINTDALAGAFGSISQAVSGRFEILFYPSVGMGSGRHSNNPWLMELPDPIAKLCWDNVASMSPMDAEKLGIQTGDVVKIGNDFSIPAFIQPGQAEGTVSVALGYGHTASGKVADKVGVNVYPFITFEENNRKYGKTVDSVEKTEAKVQLALTQTHHSMEGRAIVRETSLTKYLEDPASGNELHAEFESKHQTLYPDVKFDGFHWGLGIDLNSCVGCSACVIACQSENNIPVVGKGEVARRRIMHWIKIDRYYSDSPNEPMVVFQPLMCQHCDNAPCENVCPVSATNHSSEGLNQMSYNRCIGTKYCINNCPYKVRRFNWYNYTNNKAFDFNMATDLGKLVLNPDVTVRERGVVEKCSFCVQRIQETKLSAKLDGRAIEDGEVQPACVQACPSNALIFGNMNDKNSKVSKMKADPRNYHLLEELHTLPSVGYLTKVRNIEEA
ncbi:MAG: 4Fe-4S dicluster domain-containing protein [Bacteroidales bacterium]|nr:4Fe-4S dicluster domain-containing protein [Bacteroidales bacterium]MCB8999680.1 4Fe-4S dicluster domain-containing protein [Bacteroidales bacterium]